MKTHFTLFLLLLTFCAEALLAQSVRTITDADLTTGQYTWSRDTVYYLNGPVVLEAGGELTIEAGTVVRGIELQQSSQFYAGSALFIANGARLLAEGTAEAPIIFTAADDDLAEPDEVVLSGRWGGIYLLGDAPVSLADTLREVGYTTNDTLYYGGSNLGHDAGVLRYVSIRFAGQPLTTQQLPAGLNLLGVGNQTIIDHVETFGCRNNGFTFNGGSVNTTHLVASLNQQRGFYLTNGYRGKGQFWLGIDTYVPLVLGFPMIFIEGNYYGDTEDYSKPDLANITLLNNLLNNATATTDGIYFDQRAAGTIRNSVFTNLQPWNLTIKKRADNAGFDSYTNLVNGEITLTGNVFNSEGAVRTWEQMVAILDNTQSPVIPYIPMPQVTNNNELSDELLVVGSCPTASLCLDPRPRLNSPILTGGTPINEPGFVSVPYQGAFGPDGYWIANWTATAGEATLQTVSGYVRYNGLFDCSEDPAAEVAPGTILAFDDGQFTRYAVADSTGFYSAFLPEGEITVTVSPPTVNVWGACNSPTTFTVAAGQQMVRDEYITSLKDCPELYVDLSAPFLRRCFESTYFVTYGNRGSVVTSGTEIEIVLDTSLTYLSSSLPLLAQFGDTLVFAVDDLEPFDQRTFTLTVEVSCEADLGQEHCTEAFISETAGCTPFIGAQLTVSGYCDGDSIFFRVKNVGTALPPNPVNYIVIEDEIMLREGTVHPGPGEEEEFSFAAGDATFHLGTDAFLVENGEQSPPALFTISCSDEPNTPLASFPVTNIPSFGRDCQTNIGAFDPNDKYGYPLGLTDDHLVPVDPSFTYRIRFQNTGTDTAFNVVVLDTLSELLDITTLRMGTASHAMEWTLEDRTLKVAFPNIMLPDSFVNEPLSNGFFTFRIAAVTGLDIGTTINNQAGIYFDFNEPIITNQTYHTISRFFAPTFVVDRSDNPQGRIRVAPQPASRFVRLIPENYPAANGSVVLFDSFGRSLRQGTFTKTEIAGAGYEMDIQDLVPGIYYFRISTPDGQAWGSGKVLVR